MTRFALGLFAAALLASASAPARAPQDMKAKAQIEAAMKKAVVKMTMTPAEAKDLLQTAAVIGPEVPVPLLQAIAKLPEDALQRCLAHLQTSELLYETRLVPEQIYTFKHALTHEVAYGRWKEGSSSWLECAYWVKYRAVQKAGALGNIDGARSQRWVAPQP